ncbi:MAG: phage portal protein [Desulfuromonadales bacterium]
MPVLGRALRKGITVVRADEGPRLLLPTIGRQTAAGRRVAPSTALTAGAVYSAVRLNAQTVAQLPIDFIDQAQTPPKHVLPPSIPALWGRPNTDDVRVTFYETVVLSLMLWGNFYGGIRRNGAGAVAEVWPIDPDLVSEIERVDEQGRILDGAALREYEGPVGTAFKVEGFGWVKNTPGQPPMLLHIPWIKLPGRIKGLSPVEWHAEQIGMSLSAQEYASRILGDGGAVSGTIETPADLEPDEAKELWENWQLAHAGPRKAGGVGVLTGGATFKTITIPPNQLQFLEQMQYSDGKIASIYGVPPHMVGDTQKSTSWGSGIFEQTTGYKVFTIVPIVQRIEQYVEVTLLTGTRVQMRFQANGLLRGSHRDRAEFYRVLWSIGAMSNDEIRGFEDLGPIPGGHGGRYYVPLNVAPIDAPTEDIESRFRLAAASGAFNNSIAPVAPAEHPQIMVGGA